MGGGSNTAAFLLNFLGYKALKLCSHVIQPKSKTPDERRQEYIFNVLLFGLLVVAIFALAVTIVNAYSDTIAHYGNTLAITISFTIGIVVLIVLSRWGKYKAAVYLLLLLIAAATLQMLVQWGYMLPTVLLLEVLIIVIAGVLLGARKGLFLAVVVALTTVVAGYLHQTGFLTADTSWTKEPYYVGDAIGFAGIFAIIGIVSWLSNKEIDSSLQRARKSEKALEAERDSLEIKVTHRTRQLEEAQLVRIMELQKFAEFGRLNANLLHEIANPLTAASLNLELSGQEQTASVRQAQKNLKHLERYIAAARHQLNGLETISTFSIRNEIEQLLSILRPRAKTQKILIRYRQPRAMSLHGNAVKFNQLVGNLLVNAVDSYAKVTDDNLQKVITVTATKKENHIVITVEDNGAGMAKTEIDRIFRPFYTTKTANQRSLGIGLVMVKQYVENDFNGSISVHSERNKGTVFRVQLRNVDDAKY